jgi:hypothetical protein
MILGHDREPLVARIDARPSGDGPAFQDPSPFEAEIVVQTRRIVLLHEKTELVLPRPRLLALGFACAGEIPLGVVG